MARYSMVTSVAVPMPVIELGQPILFLTLGLTCLSHRGTLDPGNDMFLSHLSQREAQILYFLISLPPSLIS